MSAWHEKARAMKAAQPDRSYASIGRELCVSTTAVWRALHSEKAREENLARNAYKRAWDNAHRAACTNCGAQMRANSLRADGTRRGGDVCKACRTERRVARVLEMVRLRREGRLNSEIAELLGTTRATVATELHRLAACGFDVPPSPYHRRKKVRRDLVHDAESEALGRALRERGIVPPALPDDTRVAA